MARSGAEEGAEAGLGEVAVGGEGVGEGLVAHDGEGDAVGEAPGLVPMGLVEVKGTGE
jgi:hypothetical protein